MGATVRISSALVSWIMRLATFPASAGGGQNGPIEQCGILLGHGSRVTEMVHTRNVADQPATTFEIDPAALLREHRGARRAGAAQVLGWFHTHPGGSPFPSVRDAECAAADGMLWLIATAHTVRLWRAVAAGPVHGRFEPVRFDLGKGAGIEARLVDVQHVACGSAQDVCIEERPA